LGGGEQEGALSNDTAETIAAIQRITSTGFIRSPGIMTPAIMAAPTPPMAQTPHGDGQLTATATVETAISLSETVTMAVDDKLTQVRQAKAQGYEGDACDECGNFTLVRNGTCMKCVTCGATSGCS
jgi:ribonucleoside-diphosphate reductase alpha chain